MPATQFALRLTDAYRGRIAHMSSAVDAVVRGSWAQVRMEDLDGSYQAWLVGAATLVTAAQREGVHLSDAYLAAYLAAELAEPVAPQGVSPDQFAGQSRDGRPLAESLLPPLFTIKIALGEGKGFERALREGLGRASRSVAREVVQTPRDALDEAMRSEERVVGWRRVTAGNACLACLAAATGAIQKEKETLAVHDHCHCSKEPVVLGVTDRFQRPTGDQAFRAMPVEEQDRLYGEKAKLVRDGQVPLHELIDHSRQRVLPDQITERPLEALTP